MYDITFLEDSQIIECENTQGIFLTNKIILNNPRIITLLKKAKKIGYNEIKLFPLKSNIPTIEIMKSYDGKITGEFKKEKYIVIIPVK